MTLAAHLIRLIISLTTLSPVSGSFQSNFPFLLMRGGSTSLSKKNVSTITVSSRRISTSQQGLSLAFFLTGRGSETVWRSSIVLFVARVELRRRVRGDDVVNDEEPWRCMAWPRAARQTHARLHSCLFTSYGTI